MTAKNKTQSELYAAIDAVKIAEKAADAWETKQANKKPLSQRVAPVVPVITIGAFLAALLINWIFTVQFMTLLIAADGELYTLIRWLSPLAIEGFLAVVAWLQSVQIMRHGIDSKQAKDLGRYKWSFFAFSVLTTVIGGLQNAASLDWVLSLEGLVNIASDLTVIYGGILFSVASMVASEILNMIASGNLDYDVSVKELSGMQLYSVVYQALLAEAHKHTSKRAAEKYAKNRAAELCEQHVMISPTGAVIERNNSNVRAIATRARQHATQNATIERDSAKSDVSYTMPLSDANQQLRTEKTDDNGRDNQLGATVATIDSKSATVAALKTHPELMELSGNKTLEALRALGYDVQVTARTVQRAKKGMQS